MVNYILVEDNAKLAVRYISDDLWKVLQAQQILQKLGTKTILFKEVEEK